MKNRRDTKGAQNSNCLWQHVHTHSLYQGAYIEMEGRYFLITQGPCLRDCVRWSWPSYVKNITYGGKTNRSNVHQGAVCDPGRFRWRDPAGAQMCLKGSGLGSSRFFPAVCFLGFVVPELQRFPTSFSHFTSFILVLVSWGRSLLWVWLSGTGGRFAKWLQVASYPDRKKVRLYISPGFSPLPITGSGTLGKWTHFQAGSGEELKQQPWGCRYQPH